MEEQDIIEYPIEILPNPSYKLIGCDLTNHYLIRYTDTRSRSELVESSTGFVKTKYIGSPRTKLIDLSTSILGVYKFEHTEIYFTDESNDRFTEYCEPDIEPVKPLYNEDFLLNTNRGHWLINIGEIHNTSVDYTIGEHSHQAVCKIVHTPTRGNFWHFSVRWLLEEEYWNSLDPNGKKGWSKRLAHEARTHLQKYASIEDYDGIALNPIHYTKERVGD
jgi:hypothetical protein